MSDAEVTKLRASRSPTDDSAREVDGELDGPLVCRFVAQVRAASGRGALDHDTVVHNFGIVGPSGRPTVAALAMLGDVPERTLNAARVAYSRHPTASDSGGARHEGTHFEATLGQLLDDTMARLARDLPTIQIERDGAVVDDSDVPRTALRELISNALVHRSFTDSQLTASITVDVFDEAVAITSPGGIHVGTDPATLGMLGAPAGVRNLTLIRIAEQMTTPSGGRIVEQQNMGIQAADVACRRAGAMPALFADLPTAFQATLLRGALDVETAAAALAPTGAIFCVPEPADPCRAAGTTFAPSPPDAVDPAVGSEFARAGAGAR